jgi:hypothetical protein
MQQRRHHTTGAAADERPLGPSAVRTRSEQLCLRNYDEHRSYRIRISVSRPDAPSRDGATAPNGVTDADDCQYEAMYELAPGEVTTEMEVVPPGRYDVTVAGTADPASDRRDAGPTPVEAAAACNVGAEPPQTVVVEVGNGVVSVTEGLVG